jgi:hypothetical protein
MGPAIQSPICEATGHRGLEHVDLTRQHVLSFSGSSAKYIAEKQKYAMVKVPPPPGMAERLS